MVGDKKLIHVRIQGENKMPPLMRGHSSKVVGNNIKELMNSGRKSKQAIAISLANARKYKKMADGGQVMDDGGMEDMPETEYGMGGDDASLAKMDEKGPEDRERDIRELNADGNYYPDEVSNPNEQDEARGFAEALRRKAMGVESPEAYAMGGLVEGMTDTSLGTKPDEDMRDRDEEDEESPSTVGKPVMEEPMGMGLSREAIEALRMKKKNRKFM
jgi:hypothetical protein